MANITRDQFNEDNNVVKKIFQQGSFVADADLNEQIDIINAMHRRTLSAVAGYNNYRIGEGFKVIGTGASLSLTIKAGRGIFHIDDESAVLLNLPSDYTLTGFSSFSSERTDYIYLDIYEEEISPTDDPNIVNPEIGEETCRDLRLKYDIKISEGTAPGTPSAGHTYIPLAYVTSDDNYLSAQEVYNLLDDYIQPRQAELGALNVIKNGGFSFWSSGVSGSMPDYWNGSNVSGVGRYLSDYKFGNCSVRVIWGTGSPKEFYQTIDDYQNYRSKTVKAICYLKPSSSSSDMTFKLQIHDGIGYSETNPITLSSAQWYKFEIEHNVSDAANQLKFNIINISGSMIYIYVNGCALFVGPYERDFEDNPLAYPIVQDRYIPLYVTSSITFISENAKALNDDTLTCRVEDTSGSGQYYTVLRIPYIHRASINKIVLKCKSWITSGGSNGKIRLFVGIGANEVNVTEVTATDKEIEFDLSEYTIDNYYEIALEINIQNVSAKIYCNMIRIFAVMEA